MDKPKLKKTHNFAQTGDNKDQNGGQYPISGA